MPDQKEPRFAEALKERVERVPAGYAASRESLVQLSDEVRTVIAAALEPRLNAEARTRPQSTYEKKKDLAKWVNAELRRFGLALKVEGVDHPCLLMANTGGGLE